MRKHRSRLGGKRHLPSKRSRPGTFISKRLTLASPELLELRTFLSGSAPLDPVGWYGAYSARSILSSSALANLQASSAATSPPPATSFSSSAVDNAFNAQSIAAASSAPLMNSQAATGSPVFSPLTGESVEFTIKVEDLQGNAISTLTVGQDFQVEVDVQDIRNPADQFAGVYGAYVLLEFNNTIAAVATGATPTFGPGFAAFNAGGEFQVTANGTTSQIMAGTFGTSTTPPASGNALQTLFHLQMHANASGNLTFQSLFDTGLGHDTLLFNPPDPLLANEIRFGSTSVQVFSATQPTVSVAGGAVAETNSGTTPLVFTVSLSSAFAQAVAVQYTTADGTGANAATVADQDYQAKSGSISFAPGVTSQLVTVLVNGDTKNEADETFSLQITSATNATVPPSTSAVGTINNDDNPPTVSITPAVEHDEGNPSNTTNFVFTVTLSNPSGLQVTVPFNTADGTATTADNDYTGTTGVLTFAPNTSVLTQLITVVVNGDGTNEPNETFSVVLGTPTNATVASGQGTGAGTIINDDGPRISFVNGTKVVQHLEGNSGDVDFVFEVSSGVADPSEVTVPFATQDGAAPNGATSATNDYVPTSGILTFAPNTTDSQFITVKVKGDTINEANEAFLLVLGNPTNATLLDTSATGVITDDDPISVGFAQDSLAVQQAEGNSGTTDVKLTVVLSAPSEQTITVAYGDQGGTATKADNDYNLSAGSLTFTPQQTSQVITVQVRGDTKFEDDESFSMILASPSAGTLTPGASTSIITINNDDAPPDLTLTGPTQNEGTGAANTPFVFTLSLSAISGKTVTVGWQAADGTATVADNDYVASSGTATIAAGAQTTTITVPVVADAKREGNEQFAVNLDAETVSANEAMLANSTANATVNNDDAVPTISISNPAVTEGTSSGSTTTPAVFTLTLSNPTDQQVAVAFAAADGTTNPATLADDDYQAASGTATFAPNTTTAFVTVQVVQDSKDEVNETFRVLLTSPSNASISSTAGTGTGTINDDDGPPSIVAGPISEAEGDSGLTPFVFTIGLSGPSGQTITLGYATADNTATSAGGARQDYQATSGSLTFAPGFTTQFVTVNVLGDLFKEGDESFFLNLTNPSNVSVPSSQITATIQDEETDSITFTPSSVAGFVFVNKSGSPTTKDPGELGLANQVVSLSGTATFSNLPVDLQLVTASDGSYLFGNLEPGTYTVTFEQPGNYTGGSVTAGSAGGLTYTTTIDTLGGVNLTEINFMAGTLKTSVISQRSFLSSTVRTTTTQTPPSNVLPEITSAGGAAEGFVNAAGGETTHASGTGQAGATVSLVVRDATHVSSVHTTTVDGNGDWSLTGIDVSHLDDGTLTYIATVVAPGNASLATKTAIKDTVVPKVNSITRADESPTGDETVHFTVTFSENVAGVDESDFALALGSGITDAQITSVAGSGATYTVTVNRGTGTGTLGLNLVDDDSIADAAANALGGSGLVNGDFTGESYTIEENNPLTAALVDQSMGSDDSWSPQVDPFA